MKFFDLTVAVTGEKEESLQAQGRAFCKVITTLLLRLDIIPAVR